MTIQEAIAGASAQTKHQFHTDTMVRWLSHLDGMIKTELLDMYEGGADIAFTPYNPETDMEKELLVPFPYDEAYVHYLIRQINFALEENNRANNEAELFADTFYAYRRFYARTHMPVQHGGFKV